MNNAASKTLNILLKIVTWLLVAFTVFIMVFTIFTVSTVDQNDRNFFGTRFYIVKTDSMSPSENNKDMDVHFSAGDIVIISNVDSTTGLKAGDVIAFMSTNKDSYGETITHMIHEVKRNSEGKLLGYVTFGTNTGAIDEALVEPSYVLGVYSGKLPGVGNFFAFVKSTPGYILCILIPFLLLILYNGINVILLFRKYRREQAELIMAEREEIAAERKQNEEMMRELLALKAQLEQKSNPDVKPEVVDNPDDIESGTTDSSESTEGSEE